MKIYLLLVPVILASCSSYQYLRIDSKESQLNEKNELVIQNDTVRVTFNFNGPNGQLIVAVYNRTGNGLLLDRSRSAIIVGDETVPFLETSIPIKGEVNGSIHPLQSNWLDASLDATAHVQPGMHFVPPNSSIVQSGPSIVKLPSLQATIQERRMRQGRDWVSLDPAIPFRVYLTLFSASDGKVVCMLDQSFVITEEWKSEHRLKNEGSGGNIIFLKQPQHAKSAGLAGGILLLLIIAATAG